jgi:hypothetical protein
MKDIVSGSDGRGEVFVFRGLGGGAFAPRERLRSRDGNPLWIGSSAVCVADWNGDGRLDLVAGDRSARVTLLSGRERKVGLPTFDDPRRFELDEQEPVPDAQDASPLVVDWDRDGVDDLLVGYAWGVVVFYKGVVDDGGAHRVLGGEVLLQPCYEDEPETLARSELTGKLEPVVGRSHKLPKLAVWDWNGDGRLDLLVGDSFRAAGPEPLLTKAELGRRDELLRQQSAASQRLSDVRRPLREQVEQELGRPEDRRTAGRPWQYAVDERMEELVAGSEACQAATRELERLNRELEPLRAPQVSCGYVWVYLRKSASAAPAPPTR